MHSTASRPNVVLVSIDSLRADHCGFLGDDRNLTPTLDALAADGVAFRNAVAPGPQTFSSMPAVFTGRYRPPVDSRDEAGATHWEHHLRQIDRHLERHGSIAERLGELGYATAGFSPNPWTSTSAGWDRGFDHFSDFSSADGGRLRGLLDGLPRVDADSKPVELAVGLLTGSSFFARWEEFYGEVTEVVDGLPEPYFLWVFLLDTHFPFVASRRHRAETSLPGAYAANVRAGRAMRDDAGEPSERVRASIQRSYRDAVRATDAFLARLRADLEDDHVLFVHSDHGESFGEHGNYGHSHADVFEENVRVPYVVHGAGATGDVEAPTSLATIHDAVLATATGDRLDPAAHADSVAYARSAYGGHRAARGRRFKYVDRQGTEQLFDLGTDPDERVDLSDDRPDRRRDLAENLAAFERRVAETEALAGAARAVAGGDL